LSSTQGIAADERQVLLRRRTGQVKFSRLDVSTNFVHRDLQQNRDLVGGKRRGLRLALLAEYLTRAVTDPNNFDFMRFDTDFGALPDNFFHCLESSLELIFFIAVLAE
jgi:hypothetical protein